MNQQSFRMHRNNISPDLTKSFPIQDANINDFHNEPKDNSMFVKKITENEIVSDFKERHLQII